MAADENDEIESEDTKKPIFTASEVEGSKYLRKIIVLLAEKANIMEICTF